MEKKNIPDAAPRQSATEAAPRKYYSSPASSGQPEMIAKMKDSQRPFSIGNIWMMLGCVALIVIGFALMSGGGAEGNGFNPDIFSTRRIVVGPTIAFLGFLLMAFAIVWTPRKLRGDTDDHNKKSE